MIIVFILSLALTFCLHTSIRSAMRRTKRKKTQKNKIGMHSISINIRRLNVGVY